jgi:hypothetical protein
VCFSLWTGHFGRRGGTVERKKGRPRKLGTVLKNNGSRAELEKKRRKKRGIVLKNSEFVLRVCLHG